MIIEYNKSIRGVYIVTTSKDPLMVRAEPNTDGEVIAETEVVALAKLPSREALLAQIASVVVEPIACIARAGSALEEKGGASAVEAQEAPAEEAQAEAPAEESAE